LRNVRFVRLRPAAAGAACLLLLLVSSAATLAHAVVSVDPYTLAIGWLHEPTYTDTENAVQVVITDAAGQPVADLEPGDLQVVVSLGGAQTSPLSLDPTYDEDTGLGIEGDYEAPIVPTAPGDYTFHVTGSIHGTAVDQTVTAGDETFDSVVGPESIEFPNQLPAMGDAVNRLDREDTRISALEATQASGGSVQDVRDAADLALYVGSGLGILGIAIAFLALTLAWRTRRRGA
jgi:hypothetical protein